MLHPGVLAALKKARPGVAMMKKVNIYQILVLNHEGHYHAQRFTLRFTAEVGEQSEIGVKNITSTGAEFKEGFCACFVEHMAGNALLDVHTKAEILFRFIEQYVGAITQMDEVSERLCERCGRYEALESFVLVPQGGAMSDEEESLLQNYCAKYRQTLQSGAMPGWKASLYVICFAAGACLAVVFASWYMVR